MARPSFKPTAKQRQEVHALARICLPHDQIAEYVGLRSVKSLKKHFSKELQRGLSEAIAEVSRVCFEMAKSGKYPTVTTFWINTIGSGVLKVTDGESVFKMSTSGMSRLPVWNMNMSAPRPATTCMKQ